MAPPVSAQPADHQEQPDQQLLDKLDKHKQLDNQLVDKLDDHNQFDKPRVWQDPISFCVEGDFQGTVEQVKDLEEVWIENSAT